MTEREMEPPGEARRIIFADATPVGAQPLLHGLESAGYSWTWTRSVTECEDRLRHVQCDVLVADLAMSGNQNMELVAVARRLPVPPAIILVATQRTLETALRCVKLKVDAYLVNPVPSDVMLQEVSEALLARASRNTDVRALLQPEGGARKPKVELPQLLGQNPKLRALTKREQQVVLQVVRGADVPAISSALFISPHTVRNHLKAIYRKLDVRSRVELVVRFGGVTLPAFDLAVG